MTNGETIQIICNWYLAGLMPIFSNLVKYQCANIYPYPSGSIFEFKFEVKCAK